MCYHYVRWSRVLFLCARINECITIKFDYCAPHSNTRELNETEYVSVECGNFLLALSRLHFDFSVLF